MKLKEGDKIEVCGNPLLAQLDAGVWWVVFVSYAQGIPYYGFRRFRGRGVTARHYVKSVDIWVDGNPHDLNRIDILQKAA